MKEHEALEKYEEYLSSYGLQLHPLWLDIKQALTPPTSDEVCKALSDELGEPVYFNGNKFYTFNNRVNLNTISNKNLSLIGRFYGGAKE